MPATPVFRPDPPLVAPVLRWYAEHGRDLPWRRPGTGAWPILVSEVMLQQTPVARVIAPWQFWMQRWPTPAGLAAAPSGEAVRAWGRLGYPRRALRLHAAAKVITVSFGGEVPRRHDDLLGLPGVGPYTAAAVASFAYESRHVVLDTNVRRVLARAVAGLAHPAPTPTAGELLVAETLLPDEPTRAAQWAVASMELGALVCAARSPRCHDCPVSDLCAWHRAGRPSWDGPPRVGHAWHGTDRQCRGALLARLRGSIEPVPTDQLAGDWPPPAQRERCLGSLVADGLAVRVGNHAYALPG